MSNERPTAQEEPWPVLDPKRWGERGTAMPGLSRLNWLVWGPVWTPVQWAAGVGIGLLSGFAILKLNLLLAIPLAAVWVYLGLRRPRLVGIVGALVGLGIEWIWLLATAETFCLASLPPYCEWSLLYGPSWFSDPNAWKTLETTLLVMGAVLLIAGVALTVQLAWRLPGRQQRFK